MVWKYFSMMYFITSSMSNRATVQPFEVQDTLQVDEETLLESDVLVALVPLVLLDDPLAPSVALSHNEAVVQLAGVNDVSQI